MLVLVQAALPFSSVREFGEPSKYIHKEVLSSIRANASYAVNRAIQVEPVCRPIARDDFSSVGVVFADISSMCLASHV